MKTNRIDEIQFESEESDDSKSNNVDGTRLKGEKKEGIKRSKERNVKRLLFLCAANICRSPTAEDLIDGLDGYEADSAGVFEDSRRLVTQEMLNEADEVFVMENYMVKLLKARGYQFETEKVKVLGIPDKYFYMLSELIKRLSRSLALHGINIRSDRYEKTR